MSHRLFLALLPLTITILAGCTGCATSKEESTSSGSGEQDVVIDTQGSVDGSMTMIVSGEETRFELKHVVAYRFEYQLAGPPTRVSTWVLLTPDPINIEDLQAQLKQNQDDLMEARPLFPDGPYFTMGIDKEGELRQVSGHALDSDSTTVGPRIASIGVEQNFAIEGGRVQGEARLTKGKDDVLSFDFKIDVLHFSK